MASTISRKESAGSLKGKQSLKRSTLGNRLLQRVLRRKVNRNAEQIDIVFPGSTAGLSKNKSRRTQFRACPRKATNPARPARGRILTP